MKTSLKELRRRFQTNEGLQDIVEFAKMNYVVYGTTIANTAKSGFRKTMFEEDIIWGGEDLSFLERGLKLEWNLAEVKPQTYPLVLFTGFVKVEDLQEFRELPRVHFPISAKTLSYAPNAIRSAIDCLVYPFYISAQKKLPTHPYEFPVSIAVTAQCILQYIDKLYGGRK